MGVSIDIPRWGKEEQSHDDESPAISRLSVEESDIIPNSISRLDSIEVLSHTSDTRQKRLAHNGIEPSMEDIEGCSTDSGSEGNNDAGPKSHGETERRRAQTAKFNSWLVTLNTQDFDRRFY